MEGIVYKSYDAIGLSELIRKGEVQPGEVFHQAVRTIESYNPALNAVINTFYEKAEKALETIDMRGAFAGVPMLLKDITQEIAGERITSGSKALKEYIAKKDSEYVRQVKKTGVLFLGQTNVPEFALMGITEPLLYGPARNPWNPGHTPGGSIASWDRGTPGMQGSSHKNGRLFGLHRLWRG